MTGADVAELLMPFAGQIADELIARYERYGYPVHTYEDDPEENRRFVHSWTLRNIMELLNRIERDGVAEPRFSSWITGSVPSHYELLAPLYNRLEMVMLELEACANILWKACVHDPDRCDEALQVLARCASDLFAHETRRFFESRVTPEVLARVWDTGPSVVLGSSVTTSPFEQPFATHQTQHPQTGQPARPEMTPRQRQIAQLVIRGKSNGEIAAELGIAANTVKNHIASLFDLYNVGNRTELAMLLSGEGLLD